MDQAPAENSYEFGHSTKSNYPNILGCKRKQAASGQESKLAWRRAVKEPHRKVPLSLAFSLELSAIQEARSAAAGVHKGKLSVFLLWGTKKVKPGNLEC